MCDVYVGVGVALLRLFPLFVSWSMILLPKTLMCAPTFCILMLCLVHRIRWTMVEISSFSEWLCWTKGWGV